MNKYNLEDIKLGMMEEFKVKVTQEMQDKFREISGDVNPMHSNCKFAQKQGFSNVLVYGMLTAAFFSKLVGVYLPGEKCLFQECKDIKFHLPVYINDELNVKGEIVDIDERFRRITIKALIYNKDEKKVCSAKLIVGII